MSRTSRAASRRFNRYKPFREMNRRQQVITVTSVVVLLTLATLILTSPRFKAIVHGPTPAQVAYQRERARAEDLSRQLAEANAKLQQPRPMPTDRVLLAKAESLKEQLDAANAKLKKPRPLQTDTVQLARADDLQAQLSAAIRKLRAPRYTPPPVIKVGKTKQQIIASRRVFGMYTAQSPFQYAEFSLVQDAVRRQADISGYFQSWHDGFRPDAIQSSWAHGQIPLLTWESQDQVGVVSSTNSQYSLPRIINGNYDDYIRSYAAGVAKLKMPVIMRFDHEMNGNWYPWSEAKADRTPINGNHKGDYAAMWRHVWNIFQAQGANNYVVWLWAPNRVNAIPNQPDPKAFYPGDRYVDIIGMSGYYRPYDVKATFEETYGKTLPLLRQASERKPLLLAEIGASEDRDKKAYWERQLFAGLARNPDIMGFVWFNFAVTSNQRGTTNTNDWRINSTPKSTRTMSQLLWQFGYGKPRGSGPIPNGPAPSTGKPTPDPVATHADVPTTPVPVTVAPTPVRAAVTPVR